MHSLLKRQMDRRFGSLAPVPEELATFLADVEQAYADADFDRLMLERAIDLSSSELEEANAALRGVLQALPDIFIHTTSDGKILDCRGGADEAFLHPPHALVGRYICRVPDLLARAALEAGMDQALATGALTTVDYVLKTGSRPRIYEARIVPLLESQMVFVIRDVTARYQAEEDKTRRQAFLRHVVDLNPSLISAKDSDGRFTFVNTAIADAFGTTVELMLGTTEGALGRPQQEIADCSTHEREVILKGVDHHVPEERFTTPQGRVRWLQTVRRAIPGTEGGDRQVLTIATDISELRHAKHDLRQRTERLHQQHNALHDLVTSEGADNPQQIERIITVSAQELGADRVSLWLLAPDRSAFVLSHLYEHGMFRDCGELRLEQGRHPRLFAAAAVSRTIAAVDARLDMRTNELTPDYLVPQDIKSMLAGPIRQDSGLVGLICHESIARPRRWSPEEEQFIASVSDLLTVALAGDRQRLLERQLLQSQKMEAIGALAAGVAHDFNNLLSAIIGFADLTLKRLAPDAPPRRSVEQIVKAAQRGGSLTRQLLTFSRKQPLPPQVIDLNAIVRDMEPMLRRLIGEDVTIQIGLDRHIGRILGDTGQIEQVLLNLLVNARDAVSSRGAIVIETSRIATGTLKLGHPPSNLGKSLVVLTIRDSGVGMTPETQARIFEPFYTTKATGQGSGLGLSTVYGIVRQMGGDIQVDSRPGHGSTFSVHLPEVDGLPHDTSQAEPRVARHVAGHETVLVVEDDEQVLTLVIETLEHHGYATMGAATGLEALMLSEQCPAPIDLMVADVSLPLLDGPRLVMRVREGRPDMKVLFMSAIDRGLREEFRGDARRTRFVSKPFMPDDLMEQVRSLLDGDEPGGSGALADGAASGTILPSESEAGP